MITKNKTWDAVIKVAVLFIWLIAMSILGVEFFYPLFSSQWSQAAAQFIIYILIIIPVIFLQKFDKISKEEIGLSFQKLGLQILIGLGAAIVLYGILFLISLPSINSISDLAQSWRIDKLLLNVAVQFLIVAIVEEYVFRGYIQAKLRRVFEKRKWLSPIIQGILFAAWHFRSTFLGIIFIFLIGLTFGFLREYFTSGKLPSLVIAHGFYNSLYVIVPIIIGLKV